MFGTEREIKSFHLFIHALDSEEESEKFNAFGCIGHTLDWDSRSDTYDDIVEFEIRIKPSQFEYYVSLLRQAQLDKASLYLSGVEGFYAPWSMDQTTGAIKVLTANEKEHVVERPPGSETSPLRLGTVNQISLRLTQIIILKPIEESVDFEADAVNISRQDVSDLENKKIQVAQKNGDVLGSLRLAAWIMALLLLIIVLRM